MVPWGHGHSPKSDRVQETFGQLSQAHGGTLGKLLCKDKSWI